MFQLSDEQRALVRAVHDLAESEFESRACAWQGEFPRENVELLADRGYLGINFPEEYGGGGLTELEALLVVETVGRVCPDTAEFLLFQQFVAPRAIEMFGSADCKERYLPGVVAGESFVAIAISEPEAGSDVKSMMTTVREEEGELYIDGEKTWVGYVPESSAAVVWAKFPESMGAVVVELDTDGITIEDHYTNMAGHSQTHFTLDDVHVPAEHVLTRGEAAFEQQLDALNWERLGTAVIPIVAGWRALDEALEYAETREQFGQPIGDFQGIEWKLADMATDLQAARALTYHAAFRADARDRAPDPMSTAMAKLFAGRTGERVVSEALQIHGANGYQQGHPLEYLHRFVRAYRIAGGTDEMQQNVVARALKRGQDLDEVL